MAGELHDNAETKAFTPAGADSSRLVVNNTEMATFQGNRWNTSTTATLDREQALFGRSGSLDLNAFDMSQGNIYGKTGGDLLAYKPNQTDVSDKTQIADKPHEKLLPKDGDHLTLKQVLNDYKTPFMDAYERSKQLKDGEPGKSKTLEEVVDRLKACPWADKIWVDFKVHPKNPEYSNENSTITIDLADTPQKQIENFAHEGFHATHQFLSKQYDHGKLTQQDYVNTWLGGEVDSMLVETQVHHELGSKGDSPKFKYVQNGQVQPIDIEDYVNKHGKQGFAELLRNVQPTGQSSEPYGQHYAKFYQDYVKFFDQNKPAVDQYIQNWVKSGHRREDI